MSAMAPTQKLEREQNIDLIQTAPNVTYEILKRDGGTLLIDNPEDVPDSGQIRIGQRSLSECSLGDWRSQIGYVQQDPVLFHDTIFQNVSLGVDTISNVQVEEALTSAGAFEFVNDLSEGLNTGAIPDWCVSSPPGKINIGELSE